MAHDGAYDTKNYEKVGGDELHVSGKLFLDTGGVIVDDSGNLLKTSYGTRQFKFTGHNGAGACTATGAKVGDRVSMIFGQPAAGGDLIVPVIGTDFEATISVADQIQQLSASDLHLDSFVLALIAAS